MARCVAWFASMKDELHYWISMAVRDSRCFFCPNEFVADLVTFHVLCTYSVQLPIGFSFSAAIARSFITVAFLGHLGTDYLAAASVASLWMNVSSTCLWQGLLS